MSKPFVVGDRVFNTGNTTRSTVGIVTDVIDDEWCRVLWSNPTGVWNGTIRRDGIDPHVGTDRIVRVKLSVRIIQEV